VVAEPLGAVRQKEEASLHRECDAPQVVAGIHRYPRIDEAWSDLRSQPRWEYFVAGGMNSASA